MGSVHASWSVSPSNLDTGRKAGVIPVVMPVSRTEAHTLDWLFEDSVTVDTAQRAIEDAERHPSWSLP